MKINKAAVLQLDNLSYDIIDVRDLEEYNKAHIPDAKHIPLDRIHSEVKHWSKKKIYITTCGKGGGRSDKAAQILNELGFNSCALTEGTIGWLANE